MNTSQQRIWKPNPMIFKATQNSDSVINQLIMPENMLERQILSDEDWRTGAFWGEPRSGHPEGKIIYHIQEVLTNVDKAATSSLLRQQLRLVTILHDTFKHLEEQTRPRTDWSKHHAIFALNFAKKYISDKAVLDVIELHDEAFYAWRAFCIGEFELSDQKINDLVERLGNNLQLFYLFFKCDTQTGDKYQMPISWFEARVKEIKIINF